QPIPRLAMPFFLIVPAWLFLVLIGIILLSFRQARFLSLYFILVSTIGTIVSLALSTIVLWLIPRLFGETGSIAAFVFIALYLASIALGGVIGGIAGFIAARKLNQRFRRISPV